MYTRTHKLVVIFANIVGLAILLGILFGNSKIPPEVAPDRTYRQIFTAVWITALPLWFMIEEWLFPVDAAHREQFIKNQQMGRVIWIAAAGLVAGVIGTDLGKTDNNRAGNDPKQLTSSSTQKKE